MKNLLKLKVLWTRFRLIFNRKSPHRKFIQNYVAKYRNFTKSLKRNKRNSGRGGSVATDENIESTGVIGKQRKKEWKM